MSMLGVIGTNGRGPATHAVTRRKPQFAHLRFGICRCPGINTRNQGRTGGTEQKTEQAWVVREKSLKWPASQG